MGKSFYIFTCDRLKRPRGGQPRWKKEAVFLQMFALEALEISPTSLTIDEEEEEEEEKEEEFCRVIRISVKAERVHQPRWAVSAWADLGYDISLSLYLEHGPNPEWAGKKAELTPG